MGAVMAGALRLISGGAGAALETECGLEPAGDGVGEALWRLREPLGEGARGQALEAALEHWMKAPEPRGLVVGESVDPWSGHSGEPRVARTRRLMERFRGQSRHTLHLVTSSARVRGYLREVAPTPRVVLSWRVNAPAVAETFEAGALQAGARLGDARICRETGWRVHARVEPMIPVPGWQVHYAWLSDVVAMLVQPERVTLRAWRPFPMDALYGRAELELRRLLDPAPDGGLRVRGRAELYRLVWSSLYGRVPFLSIEGEDRDLEELLRRELGNAATLPPPGEVVR